jgi:hypothetical protein
VAHTASVRPQPANVARDDAGEVRISGVTGLWEVICTDCGDDGGPFEEQPEHVQRIRGPYSDPTTAFSAATEHVPAAGG